LAKPTEETPVYDALQAETIFFPAGGGDLVEGYYARPLDSAPRGSVIVNHHMPGYDDAAKELTRRLAFEGYNALCPNLYFRDAPGASPDDAAAASRAAGGVPRDRFLIDTAAAATYLRAIPNSNGKVGIIGFCSGGRQSVLAACHIDVDAAVDCYGGLVVGQRPDAAPATMTALYDDLPTLSCPLLGIFGSEDRQPAPEHVEELRGLLTSYGKDFEFHSYEAGHGFLQVDRPNYRPLPAVAAWTEILDFYGRKLGQG
jgi:carboxymethylenebutenolidase